MKNRRITTYLLSAAVILTSGLTTTNVSFAQRDSLSMRSSKMMKTARVGKKAPNFTLTDQYGKKHSLKDFKDKTVVLEWTNPGCPFVVRHYEAGTTVNIQKRFASKGKDVVWLRINSTSKSHKDFLSHKETQAWAKENNVTGLVLGDADGKVGHLYGAKSTPNMFVIDKSGKLIFSGAMDNDPYGKKKAEKRENYVENILAAWSSGEKVEAFANDSYGCGIKYAKH